MTVVSCTALVLTSAAATPLAWADDPKPEVKATDEGPKALDVADRWGLRGGATLGDGMAMRVQFSAGTPQNVNAGYLNLEAGMLFALSKSFDIGFNLRVPLFNFGVSPGLAVRVNLIGDTNFKLAIVGNLQIPFMFTPGFGVGLSVEPGIMASYFFSERTELYTGLMFAVQPIFSNPWVPGSGHVGFSGLYRLGFAYTLSTSNTGFFINADVGGGVDPIRQLIIVGNRATAVAFNAALTTGVQFKL